jgi:hypothetical protein
MDRVEIANTNAGMRVDSKFDPQTIAALAEGGLDVICHRGFYDAEICSAVLPNIRKACDAANYTLTSDLQSIGTSMGEAEQSCQHEAEYFATAPETKELIRNGLFRTFLSPVDRIRLLADESWPAGATIARVKGKPMLSGIVRRWVAGGHANPHIDQKELAILSDLSLHRRIGINVYLAMPDPGAGGDIEFWHRVTDETEYEKAKRSDYGLDRDALGDPSLVITPSSGDLVAFDAGRIHGVRGIQAGERVTVACFLGVRDTRHPLYQFA